MKSNNKRVPFPAFWMLVILLAILLAGACSRGGIVPDFLRGSRHTPDTAIQPEFFFSVNAITPFHLIAAGDGDAWATTARHLDMARDAGATTVRIDMWWGMIQDRDGNWDFSIPDRIIDMMEERNLRPFPILCYNGSAWAEEYGTAISTVENREAFGEYVYQMVRRYRGRVSWWQVWNEPNIEPFWSPDPDPVAYTLLLEETARRAREADPKARLVGMNTAGADVDFMEACYRLGAAQYIDAVAFHHYNAEPQEAILDRQIRQVRRIMERHGDGNKPLLITELGLSTGESPVVPVSEPEFQASWMVKKHLQARAGGVDQLFWFKLVDDPPHPAPDGFWGLYQSDYQAKPAATAYRTMTERLGDLDFIGAIHGVTAFPRVRQQPRVYLFSSGRTTTAVAWMENDHDNGAILLPARNNVRVEDINGVLIEEIAPQEDGLALIPVGSAPRYIRNLGGDAVALASLKITPTDLWISPGDTRKVALSFRNTSSQPVTLDFSRFSNPPRGTGLVVEVPDPVRMSPNRTWKGDMMVSLAHDAPNFNRMELRINEGFEYTYEFRVHYERPFDISMRVEPAGEQVRVIAKVTNLTQAPVGGTYEWRINGGSRDGDTFAMDILEPLETRRVEKLFDVWPGENVYSIHVESEKGVRSSGRFSVWGQQMTSEPPERTGTLEVWNRQPHVALLPARNQHEPPPSQRLLTPADTSARVYTAWTPTHLHFAIDVTDPVPFNNPFEGPDIWKGDSLEIYLGLGGPSTAMTYGEGDFQIALSPGTSPDQPASWNWRSLTPTSDDGAPVQGIELDAFETERGWLLKGVIPVSEFGVEAVAPHTLLGFDMHLNNRRSDGDQIRESVLIWNGNENNWRTPRAWGAAMILPDPTTLPTTPRVQLRNSTTKLNVNPQPGRDPAYRTPLPDEYPEAAAHLPDWLELRLPWKGAFRISTGYGYESGSWTHQTINNERSANDFFCLDADLPVGEPILAMAPGRIISSSRRMDSYGNYVVIDHGQGYHSIYAHLDSVKYHVHLGEPEIYVDRGDVIGTAGDSGTSWPHLHFGVHYNARQSHSGANVGGKAVVPEPVGGYYGIRRGYILDSAAGEE